MKNLYQRLLIVCCCAYAMGANAQVPALSSFPSAQATLFLDFDGQYVQSGSWNAGNGFYCAPAQMNAAQVNEVFLRVSEDFRPFDLNVTTDSAKFLAAPLNRRMRIIITPSSAWYPANVGGVSYVGSFTWGDNTPGFVFSDKLINNAKYVAECITHESGHTVGLSHQSKYDNNCQLIESYNVGTGVGEISWAPVMGNSYSRNMTGWNDGPTPYGCANTQDNLTIITSSNGFGYRQDDYAATRNTATFSLAATSFSADGIITSKDDKDAFKYVVSQTNNLHFEVNPFSVGGNAGANLDAMVELYNGNTLIRTYDTKNSLSVVADTLLNAGTYYLVVSGASNENTNNYGSLGSYTLTGFRGALAIHDVRLSGNAEKNKHSVSWNVVADEPIKTQVLEVSYDGINFKPLSTINALEKSFNYTTNQTTTVFYRLKVTSVINQTAYSNTVALKSAATIQKQFMVSTLVKSEITVEATEGYQYKLRDADGRLLGRGNGSKGVNTINVSQYPAGMYIIQLAGNNQQQTERIIKQ